MADNSWRSVLAHLGAAVIIAVGGYWGGKYQADRSAEARIQEAQAKSQAEIAKIEADRDKWKETARKEKQARADIHGH